MKITVRITRWAVKATALLLKHLMKGLELQKEKHWSYIILRQAIPKKSRIILQKQQERIYLN